MRKRLSSILCLFGLLLTGCSISGGGFSSSKQTSSSSQPVTSSSEPSKESGEETTSYDPGNSSASTEEKTSKESSDSKKTGESSSSSSYALWNYDLIEGDAYRLTVYSNTPMHYGYDSLTSYWQDYYANPQKHPSNIVEFVFGEDIVSISGGFLYSGNNVETVVFSPSVTSVTSPMIFYSGDNIRSFVFEGKKPELEPGVFTLNGGGMATIYYDNHLEDTGFERLVQIDGNPVLPYYEEERPSLPEMSVEEFCVKMSEKAASILYDFVDEILDEEFLYRYPYCNTLEEFDEIASFAKALTANCSSGEEKVEEVFRYVSDTIVYDMAYETASVYDAFKESRGVCFQYACIMHDMLASLGILSFPLLCEAYHLYESLEEACAGHNPLDEDTNNHILLAVYVDSQIRYYDPTWHNDYGTDYAWAGRNYLIYAANFVYFTLDEIDRSYMYLYNPWYPLYVDKQILIFEYGHYARLGGASTIFNYVMGSTVRSASYNDGYNHAEWDVYGAVYQDHIGIYAGSGPAFSYYFRHDGAELRLDALCEYLSYIGHADFLAPHFRAAGLEVVGDFVLTSTYYGERGERSAAPNDRALFMYLGNAENLLIPGEIGDYHIRNILAQTFAYNHCIKELTVGEGIVKIDGDAFINTNIERINLPSTFMVYGGRERDGRVLYTELTLFGSPNHLKEYTIEASNPYFSVQDGSLYSKDGKTFYAYPSQGEKIPDLDGVEFIYDGAFAFSNIVEIDIPSSVTKLGSRAFENAFALERVRFENPDCRLYSGMNFGGGNTFAYCVSLCEVELPAKLELIPSFAFAYCSSLVEITLPESLRTIESAAFYLSGLVHVTLPRSLESLTVAFLDCQRLLDVTNDSEIPDDDIQGEFPSALTLHGDESTYFKDGDFVYVKGEEGIIMAAYTGKDKIVTLPKEIRGDFYKVHAWLFYYYDEIGWMVGTLDLHRTWSYVTHHCFDDIEEIRVPSWLRLNVRTPKNAKVVNYR